MDSPDQMPLTTNVSLQVLEMGRIGDENSNKETTMFDKDVCLWCICLPINCFLGTLELAGDKFSPV
jgi:hypothetical protein